MNEFFNQKSDYALQKGFIGCLAAAIFCDDEGVDAESDLLGKLIFTRSIFIGFPVVEEYKNALAVYQTLGWQKLLELNAPKITDEWKPTLFAACASIIFADNNVQDSERLFLNELKSEIRLDEDIASKIIDTMLWLYKR